MGLLYNISQLVSSRPLGLSDIVQTLHGIDQDCFAKTLPKWIPRNLRLKKQPWERKENLAVRSTAGQKELCKQQEPQYSSVFSKYHPLIVRKHITPPATVQHIEIGQFYCTHSILDILVCM